MSQLSISAQLELRSKQNEMLALSNKETLTAAEKRKFDSLLSEISLLKSGALSDEVRAAQADKLAKEFGFAPIDRSQRAAEREELRQWLKRSPETRTYSPMVSTSNDLVPAAFYRELMLGIAAYDPIFDENNIRLIETGNSRPMTVPALDLSIITSGVIGQATDNPPSVNPVAGSMTLGQFTYRSNPIACSMELEQDSFESISEILTQAFSVGMARGIGADLINGDGTTAPKGLLASAVDSTITTETSGAISAMDIESIYFSVNRAYRASKKCAWVMSDAVYQMVRKAKDSADRPLIGVRDDQEVLMGKKILIAPSMPSSSGDKGIVFGDLSQYVCRVNRSSVRVTRSTQAPGYVEQGIALYTCWMTLDAALNTVNSVAPVQYATLA